MHRPLLVLAASTLVLIGSMAHAQHHGPGAQSSPPPGQQGQGAVSPGMGMMHMMQRGMGGQHAGAGSGMMGHRGMLPLMFAIMDADGDGALALQEVQDIHARIFRHIDADNNGRVTKEEIGTFFGGTGGDR